VDTTRPIGFVGVIRKKIFHGSDGEYTSSCYVYVAVAIFFFVGILRDAAAVSLDNRIFYPEKRHKRTDALAARQAW